MNVVIRKEEEEWVRRLSRLPNLQVVLTGIMMCMSHVYESCVPLVKSVLIKYIL